MHRTELYNDPGCPGHSNLEAREGHYINANTKEEALATMTKNYPNETKFTAHLFKTFDNEEKVTGPMVEKNHAIVILETKQDDMGNYIPCIVKEGETGYYMTDWKWGTNLKEANALADDYNAKLGLTKDEAYTLVLQSMRQTHRKLTVKEYLRTREVLAFPEPYIPSVDDTLIELNIIQMVETHKKMVRPTYAFDMYDSKGKFKTEWYDPATETNPQNRKQDQRIKKEI